MDWLKNRDVGAGLIMCAIGTYFLVSSFELEIGNAAIMGAGYFPALLSGLTILLGVGIVLSGLKSSSTLEAIEWRPLLATAGSIAVFASGLVYLGFVPAIFGSVAVASLGRPTVNWITVLLLGATLALSSWLIFTVGLGLPLHPFKALTGWN